jgi:N-acetylglucosamine-1-phosphodiester alpha-N-acetylglucosaminidase
VLGLPLVFEPYPKAFTLDFDETSFAYNTGSNMLYTEHIAGYYSNGRYYSGFLAQFDPAYFSFYPNSQKGGCMELIKTTAASVPLNCEYATNAGFFYGDTSSGSYCVGNLISDGKVWQVPNDSKSGPRANFGVTKNGTLVTGYLDPETIDRLDFNTLMTGYVWIVRGGISYVNKSSDTTPTSSFVMAKAPRTAVGHYRNGTMLLLQLDGQEDIKYGPDLYEFAEVLVARGVESAVNLDGGGSSVSVKNGVFIDQPTALDTAVITERAVASLACVKRSL